MGSKAGLGCLQFAPGGSGRELGIPNMSTLGSRTRPLWVEDLNERTTVSTATDTAPAEKKADKSRTRGQSSADTAAMPPPVRTRRSGIWLAAAIVLILLGAIGGAFVYTTASNTEQVFVAADAIARGDTIERDDLTTIALAAGQTTQAIPVARANDVIGKIAAGDIAAGGMITESDLTTALPVPSGQALVGLELKSSQLPAQALVGGDEIVIVPVATQSATGVPTTVDPSTTVQATVSQVRTSTSTTGTVIVDVYVEARSAANVTSLAAAGGVAIYLAPRD